MIEIECEVDLEVTFIASFTCAISRDRISVCAESVTSGDLRQRAFGMSGTSSKGAC